MDEMAVELGMDHEVNRAGVKGFGEHSQVRFITPPAGVSAIC
ncbi:MULTISPECIES: hypothetical protein [unclassified Mesorhizobium]|nr:MULTISPECIES: hypothetical protein [unclassified Mesorhizobium]